jgi:hypothetical protein
MPRVNIELTPRIAELLQAGVITITADLFSSGQDIYGRVVQPHPRLGLYPHQSMTLDELEPLLGKVKVPSIHGSPHGEDDSGSPYRTPTRKGQSVSVFCERNDPEIGKVPTQIAIAGVKNILPKSSLSWKDLLHLTDDQLNRRILAVGKEIGADKAVSRVTAQPTLNTTRGETLYKWWINANKKQRWELITTAKAVGKEPPVNKSVLDQLLDRLGDGQYPFRGTDQSLEEEEDLDALEERFEQGLRLKFDSDSE